MEILLAAQRLSTAPEIEEYGGYLAFKFAEMLGRLLKSGIIGNEKVIAATKLRAHALYDEALSIYRRYQRGATNTSRALVRRRRGRTSFIMKRF
jgi:hypothetical protein